MSVNSYLTDLSSSLIIKDDEKESITRSINSLRYRLNLYFGQEIEEQFCFGSYTRGTILPRKADENSDIDYMVVFKNSNRYKPEVFFRKLKNFVRHWYSSSEIYRDSPTIVLNLNHIKFELVPAYNLDFYGINQYYIPAPRTSYLDWILTNPNEFNKILTNKNIDEKYYIKPVIRLLKYWNSLNGHIYSSYELENHIITQGYWFDNNLKDYFYTAVSSLTTNNLSISDKIKVNRFKEVIQNIKSDERIWGNISQDEIEKLIPRV